MLWCPPGTFSMGSPTTEPGRDANETLHQVTLTKGFYLGKYEVTQAQYEAVMNGNAQGKDSSPSKFSGINRPVEKVSWNDVQIFLERLNERERTADRLPAGWTYALPTEAQWEYACRAGTTTAYSWGATIDASKANYQASGINETRDVGQYASNPWGFFDMHGNVWEWTADLYAPNLPISNPSIDPTGGVSGYNRVSRGAAWSKSGGYLRSARRGGFTPYLRQENLGFRLALKPVSASSLSNGLVAYYPFDGNASDMSGNGNHGTVNGATLVPDKEGNENSAFYFDGVNDYIDLGKLGNFSSKIGTSTIHFWFTLAITLIMKLNL